MDANYHRGNIFAMMLEFHIKNHCFFRVLTNLFIFIEESDKVSFLLLINTINKG